MDAAICLLFLLFFGSASVWRRLAIRKFKTGAFLDKNEQPRAEWQSLSELAIVYTALLWMTLNLLPLFFVRDTSRHEPLDLTAVARQAAIFFGVWMFLMIWLVSNKWPGSTVGITISRFRDQIWVGVQGFLAAILPMAISMAATLPIRGLDQQHSLLKLLANSPDVLTVILIAVTAAVLAPLVEELLFRVILQGWLTTILSPSVAISIVAVAFAAVHGWRDGLALLPLAFILGYVFHRRHSYLAVVVIHALFNATMLALQLLNPQLPQ